MMQINGILRGKHVAALALAALAAAAATLALALAPATALAGTDLAAGSADLAAQAQPAGGDAAAKAADAKAPAPETQAAKAPSVWYRTHVQRQGWQSWRRNGQTAGTSGQSLRLEGLYMKLSNAPVKGSIQYRTHVQSIGWQGWRSAGKLAGTTGQSKRLEAMQVRLTGDMAKRYDVYYRVHAQHFGWMGWARNGQSAGTAGYSYRLEAMQVKLGKKGGKAPGSTANRFHQAPPPPVDIKTGRFVLNRTQKVSILGSRLVIKGELVQMSRAISYRWYENKTWRFGITDKTWFGSVRYGATWDEASYTRYPRSYFIDRCDSDHLWFIEVQCGDVKRMYFITRWPDRFP